MTGTPALSARSSPWLLAARPATLWAAVGPIVVGWACAAALGGFRWVPALAALLCAALLQIGANYANDLFDADRGADGADRLGPARAVAAGWISRRAMATGTLLVFAGATIPGLVLVAHGGWPILLLGVAAIAAALLYTGGPLPYGYVGLGEVFVFLFFGLAAVVGTVWVQMGSAPELAWWCAASVGLLGVAVLVVNNLRDRRTDRRAGKRTLAARFGGRFARWEYTTLVVGAFALVLGAAVRFGQVSLAAPLFVAPLAMRLVREVRRRDGVELNPVLGSTARLLLGFSLLLAAGLLLALPGGRP